MGFVSEYFEVAKNVITSPTEFFENENRRDGFGYPLKFAAFSLLISGLFSAAQTALTAQTAEVTLSTPALVAISAIGTPILGLISLVITAGLVHIFVALFGGENGYGSTLAAIGYATAIGLIGSALNIVLALGTITGGAIGGIISILGLLAALLLGFYGLYVQSKGLSEFQGISFGKSVLSIILPSIVILALIVGLFIVVLGASFAAMAA